LTLRPCRRRRLSGVVLECRHGQRPGSCRRLARVSRSSDFRNSAAVASMGLFLRLRGDFHISRDLTLDRGMFYGLAAWELVPRRGGA
jgi:hypothetical protein